MSGYAEASLAKLKELTQVKLNRGELLNPSWTADPKVTGGFLYETPIHLLDMCQYLFGEVETVKCEARQSICIYESAKTGKRLDFRK